MCGIAGIADRHARGDLASALDRLTAGLAHRGPDAGALVLFDDEGLEVAGNDQRCARVGLGHRRLSIIDVANGAQPMTNEDRSIWVAFNGEIYNFAALREQLESRGHRFRTMSDTEVLVHGWEEWGEQLLPKLNGLFAFSLYDARAQRVLLARDPVGAKPLYVGVDSGRTWWASEIDAARRAGMVSGEIDLDAIKLFLMLRFIPSPWSPYRGVWKIPPSHFATIDISSAGQAPRFVRYESAIRSTAMPASTDEWRDAIAGELNDAVRRQLIADVPVGSLLSGGVDSSVITSIMAKASATPPQAFAIGFHGDGVLDETDAAEVAAKEIGVPLRTVRVDAGDYFRDWPDAARHIGEPIANSGILLVGLLCAEVRRTHKVVLTGQGADEPLGGYPRHLIQRLASAGRVAPTLSAAVVQRIFGHDAGDRLRRVLSATDFAGRAGGILGVIPADTVDALVRPSTTPTRELFAELIGRWSSDVDEADATGSMLRLDMRLSLADDLLMVADHFSMQQSVELRVPFLDLQFLELVGRLPTRYKVSWRAQRKWLYRQAVRPLLPRATARRLGTTRARYGRKVGFATPLEAWFASVPDGPPTGWLAEHIDTTPSAVASAFPSARQRSSLHALRLWLDGR